MFISHAQNFEDVMLMRALRHLGQGFYIDIGAWHPDLDSVTKAFYDQGWCGINVEPNEIVFRLLEKRRPRDKNVKVAIGTQSGAAKLYRMGDSGLTTVRQDLAQRHTSGAQKATELDVKMITLADLLDQFAADREIAFLKIDVEGHEQSVIESGDWKRHRPIVLVIEAIDAITRQPNWSEWEGHVLENEYLFAWYDGINRFYVRIENRELLAHFDRPPNIFDGFQLSRHSIFRPRWQTRVRLHLKRMLPAPLYSALVTATGRRPDV